MKRTNKCSPSANYVMQYGNYILIRINIYTLNYQDSSVPLLNESEKSTSIHRNWVKKWEETNEWLLSALYFLVYDIADTIVLRKDLLNIEYRLETKYPYYECIWTPINISRQHPSTSRQSDGTTQSKFTIFPPTHSGRKQIAKKSLQRSYYASAYHLRNSRTARKKKPTHVCVSCEEWRMSCDKICL